MFIKYRRQNMKKLMLMVILMFFVAGRGFSASFFDEFTSNLTGATSLIQKNLDSFAADLGAVIGGAACHQGKALGFPGFDVGIHISGKSVSDDNKIVKAAGLDAIALPMLQAEIGLPGKLDLIGRYVAYSGANMTGLGIRYGLLKENIPLFPSISVQVLYNNLDVKSDANKFKAATISAAGVISFNIPIVDPYVLVGMDSTTITPDSSITSLTGSASGVRAEAGINLSLVPFTYLHIGGGFVNGGMGYNMGLGIKF